MKVWGTENKHTLDILGYQRRQGAQKSPREGGALRFRRPGPASSYSDIRGSQPVKYCKMEIMALRSPKMPKYPREGVTTVIPQKTGRRVP